jgi:hypothetical protein
MNMPIEVKLSSVETALGIVFQSMRESRNGSDVVPVSSDYFWSIPGAELFDVETRPGEITIGQLSESLENLVGLLTRADGPIPYHLVWIADILRALGQELM